MESYKMNLEGSGRSESIKFKVRNGFFISRCLAITLLILFLASLLIVGLLVYYLAPRPYPVLSSSETEVDASASTAQLKASKLLPHTLRPLLYQLRLHPFLPPHGNSTFNGHMVLQLQVVEATDQITLNSHQIQVDNQTIKIVNANSAESIRINQVSQMKKEQLLVIDVDQKLTVGSAYNLTLDFIGQLNDDMAGFYRSSYTDKDGNDRWLAVTQFQPTDARRAFPCFDEPQFKAKFEISLVRPSNMTSVSNMPLVNSISREDDWVEDQFQVSVNMSTYLVAFLVSDFTFSSQNASNTQFRVGARSQAIGQVEYALKAGPKTLDFFQQYFNIKYPLPKQDMVAIPDFRAGAMENWGLITYRETALLWDPAISSAFNKQRVLTVVAHELAHQWFGNLVTPKWWDDLWLNEGFATFMEYLGANNVEPAWKMMDQFVVGELMNVFELDSLATSHPISVPVNHPDEINEIFDTISYSKGASLIRMMFNFLGEDAFRKGLTSYLTKFSYGNAAQDDLWLHLTEAANAEGQGIAVKEVMDSWTKQTGYPVITVTRDYSSGKVFISQKRFYTANNTNSSDKASWPVPITYTTSENPDFNSTKPQLWLPKSHEGPMEMSNLTNLKVSQWIMLNIKMTSYYRVNYDEITWKLLQTQLHSDLKVIDNINRAQLVNDAMDLARGGLLSYNVSLNITSYLIKEQDFLPWDTFNQKFAFIDSMLQYTAAYGYFKTYVQHLISPIYQTVGFDEASSDPHLTKLLRSIILSWACKVDVSDCLKKSAALYKQWMDMPDSDPISPNIKKVVTCYGVKQGSEKEWNFAFQRYKQSNVASEKDTLLAALSCSREPWILGRLLNMTLYPSSGIRKADATTVFSRVATNSIGHFLAFDFLRDKWLTIQKLHGGSFPISGMVKSVINLLNSPFQLEQLKSFVSINKDNLGTANRTFQQSLEETEANVYWMNQSYSVVAEWLERQKQ